MGSHGVSKREDATRLNVFSPLILRIRKWRQKRLPVPAAGQTTSPGKSAPTKSQKSPTWDTSLLNKSLKKHVYWYCLQYTTTTIYKQSVLQQKLQVTRQIEVSCRVRLTALDLWSWHAVVLRKEWLSNHVTVWPGCRPWKEPWIENPDQESWWLSDMENTCFHWTSLSNTWWTQVALLFVTARSTHSLYWRGQNSLSMYCSGRLVWQSYGWSAARNPCHLYFAKKLTTLIRSKSKQSSMKKFTCSSFLLF